MSRLFGQDFKLDCSLAPQAIASTTASTAANLWRSMKLYHSALFIITGIGGTTETVVCTVKQATDAAGTDPQNLTSSITGTITFVTVASPVAYTGLTRVGYLEVTGEQVFARGQGTHMFIGISVETDATNEVGVVLIRANPRYARGLTNFPDGMGTAATQTGGGQADL